MNSREFFDWQTLGGGNDVERLISVLATANIRWCMIGGLAVNHWAIEPMATADVDIVIGASDVDRAVQALVATGFTAETCPWSINLRGQSKVSVQISTDSLYQNFTNSAVLANVHGINMPVASLENTLVGKVAAWRDHRRRPSKRQKDFLDIMRLTEAHPYLIATLPDDIAAELIERNK